jgi:hypothetical protein
MRSGELLARDGGSRVDRVERVELAERTVDL